jgi:putative redox protein
MNVQLLWKEKMHFVSKAGTNEVHLDATVPIGLGQAQTPKELLIAALCGCTGMDVIAWLHKRKQDVQAFEINAEVTLKEHSRPAVFAAVHLRYSISGTVDASIAEEAVRLSQGTYCGVSAMLAKAFPISWSLTINNQNISHGEATFS